MTYKKLLQLAYPTYRRYRKFNEWANAHSDGYDPDTRRNMSLQDAIMYAEVSGQIELIGKIMAGNKHIDSSVIYNDLKAMYEEKEN